MTTNREAIVQPFIDGILQVLNMKIEIIPGIPIPIWLIILIVIIAFTIIHLITRYNKGK